MSLDLPFILTAWTLAWLITATLLVAGLGKRFDKAQLGISVGCHLGGSYLLLQGHQFIPFCCLIAEVWMLVLVGSQPQRSQDRG